MNWRRINHALHRDIGFLCVGLTLLYALSGIAVNHMHDWNANYSIERFKLTLGFRCGFSKSMEFSNQWPERA